MSSNPDREQLTEWIVGATAGDRRPLARLVTLFESTHPDAPRQRQFVVRGLELRGHPSRARIIGVTGSPGAGKSSLIAALCAHLIESTRLRIAVLAVDPSSAASHGSLLGDRTRMTVTAEPRLYFRSQASRLDLGGLSRVTYSVTRLLERLFDLVIIETVGVGQSEIDVCAAADATALVMPPMAGDHVQWMKAGIMEVPDIVVLNKCDQKDAAARTWHSLRSALALAQPGLADVPRMLRTSATTLEGVPQLGDWVLTRPFQPGSAQRARFFLERWVQDEFGRAGLRRYESSASRAGWLQLCASDFEGAQTSIESELTGLSANLA
jgi:LAO/AO transport system kinase